jgi:hypothetical protein
MTSNQFQRSKTSTDPRMSGSDFSSRGNDKHEEYQSDLSQRESTSGRSRDPTSSHNRSEQQSPTEENATAENYEEESEESQSWVDDTQEEDDDYQDPHHPNQSRSNQPPRIPVFRPAQPAKPPWDHRDPRSGNRTPRSRNDSDRRSESRTSYSEPGMLPTFQNWHVSSFRFNPCS